MLLLCVSIVHLQHIKGADLEISHLCFPYREPKDNGGIPFTWAEDMEPKSLDNRVFLIGKAVFWLWGPQVRESTTPTVTNNREQD